MALDLVHYPLAGADNGSSISNHGVFAQPGRIHPAGY